MYLHVRTGWRGQAGGSAATTTAVSAAVWATVCAAVLVTASVLVQPAAHASPTHESPSLVDVAPAAGLGGSNESFSANPVDYDADGDQDVLISYHDQGAKLWRNDGGVFTRVARSAFPARNETGIPIDRHDCAWDDVNLDRRVDVYCSVGRGSGGLPKMGERPDNELWIQRADGSFVDQGTEWGVGDPFGRGRDVVFLDANGDRWPDLYVGNERPRSGSPDKDAAGSSKLYLNQGGDSFVGSPQFGLHRSYGGDCALARDLDEDGDEDVVMCGQYGVRIYRNQAHRGFTDATVVSGFPTFVEDGIEKTHFYEDVDLADLDRDGDLDLVGIRGDRLTLRLNDGRGVFVPHKASKAVTGGREVATGDADDDGDLDIFALRTNDPHTDANLRDALFLNDGLTFSRHFTSGTLGRGDTVERLNYDSDGDADFLVLNGRDVAGPVQLFSYR